ncbi:hypothetical protein [Winogradskya humida]|uniref:hypothetical protein n=1 Tax=Winogradskya humida TaxID=113566 RepID=UPI0019432355|nr:hypothetical protein [Actinoplanes humidus]
MRKRRLLIAALVAGILGAGVGTTVLAAPAVAVTVCPACYGLHNLGGNVWAETDDPRYRTMIDGARARLDYFYGERTANPRILICATDTCYRHIGGGGEKGRALGEFSLMLSPAGATETIATHELSHAELHHLLGASANSVPDWFDEGLAVLVSQDPRYLAPVGTPERCLMPYELALPVVDADWFSSTRHGNDLPYRQAACVVSRWARGHGNGTGVADLASRLAQGSKFGEVVNPQPTVSPSPTPSR